jgi:hypothetical protein
MSESTQKIKSDEKARQDTHAREPATQKPGWETPTMEDVSEQVMAQPYIRFT